MFINLSYLIIQQFLFFLVYIIFIVSRYGVLPSISDSWYKLPKDLNFLFTFFVWSISIPLFFQDHFLFALAGSSLSFVGAAAAFKNDILTKRVHSIGAVLGISLCLIALLVQGIWYPIVLTALSSLYIYYKISNKIWWIEIVAFLFIIIGLFDIINFSL